VGSAEQSPAPGAVVGTVKFRKSIQNHALGPLAATNTPFVLAAATIVGIRAFSATCARAFAVIAGREAYASLVIRT
jgi:hypothetical protein